MKKLMKAIAFATVMCMLLSVSAFAEVAAPVPTLGEEDYNFTVAINGAGTDQVALLVLKHDATLAALEDGDILYINQDAAVEGTATFSVSLVKENVTDAKVDIYAGYASAGGAVAFKDDFVVTNVQELSIVLADGVTVIPDVDKSENELIKAAVGKVTEKPEGDIGGLAYATVKFENATAKTSVTNVGWEFITGAEKRYVHYAVEGFNVLEGNVQLGVAFANGSNVDKDRVQFVTDQTTANLYFKVDGKEVQATK